MQGRGVRQRQDSAVGSPSLAACLQVFSGRDVLVKDVRVRRLIRLLLLMNKQSRAHNAHAVQKEPLCHQGGSVGRLGGIDAKL